MKNIMRTYAMESRKEGVCTYLHRKKHTNNATLDKNKRYALTFKGISHPSPLNVLDRNGQQTDKKLQINDLWLFLLPESPASKTSKVR